MTHDAVAAIRQRLAFEIGKINDIGSRLVRRKEPRRCRRLAHPLRRCVRTLSVLWDDGQRNDFDVRDLRLACRCALCVEEMSGRPLLDPKSVRPDVTPRTITGVGNYAIQVSWSDGHSAGIYSFEYLRAFGERGAARVLEDV